MFEYIRDTAVVNIIDTDRKGFFALNLACNKIMIILFSVLEINFAEPDYTFVEGSELSCLPIVLQFKKNQNPFTVRISQVTIDTAESQELGDFIDSDSIIPDLRATTGQLHMILVK